MHLSAGLLYRKLASVRRGLPESGLQPGSRAAEPVRAALGTAVLREGSGAAGAERVTGARRDAAQPYRRRRSSSSGSRAIKVLRESGERHRGPRWAARGTAGVPWRSGVPSAVPTLRRISVASGPGAVQVPSEVGAPSVLREPRAQVPSVVRTPLARCAHRPAPSLRARERGRESGPCAQSCSAWTCRSLLSCFSFFCPRCEPLSNRRSSLSIPAWRQP